MFVDEVEISVQAGAGGDGLSSFRREKHVSKGGPDGGDGGNGGDIVVRSDHNTDTLAQFRHQSLVKAENGHPGKKGRGHGKSGKNAVLTVPPGTVVYEGDVKLADLEVAGEEAVVAHGGRGGYGNAHFKTSRRQAPRLAELGESGQRKQLRMELKTVADIGLVGLPNAGKSTLLAAISNAQPKIADYPFTTLNPHLGITEVYDKTLVVADIPGLIEGASHGKGLGFAFLRHIERTKVLLHVIDSSRDNVAAVYQQLRQELTHYPANLESKPELVALNKADLVDEAYVGKQQQELQAAGVAAEQILPISGVTRRGLQELLQSLAQLQQSLAPNDVPDTDESQPTITIVDDPKAWWVEYENGRFLVHGRDINRFGERTDFRSEEALRRLRDILRKRGIDRELDRQGIQRGDPVEVGGKTFDW